MAIRVLPVDFAPGEIHYVDMDVAFPKDGSDGKYLPLCDRGIAAAPYQPDPRTTDDVTCWMCRSINGDPEPEQEEESE